MVKAHEGNYRKGLSNDVLSSWTIAVNDGNWNGSSGSHKYHRSYLQSEINQLLLISTFGTHLRIETHI